MGKSDPLVFQFYHRNLPQKNLGNVAFLGFPNHNNFTKSLQFTSCKFFDLSIDNWEINTFPYDLGEEFDAIIMTRVAYFCSHTDRMLKNLSQHLKKGGLLFLDWGLGDHWRFDMFKVGWMRNGEVEWAYDEKNDLSSGYISEKMIKSKEYKEFEKHCKKFGYEEIEGAIHSECRNVATPDNFHTYDLKIINEDCLFLWPESPQLYTCILAEKQ